jgi:hypothetical protein
MSKYTDKPERWIGKKVQFYNRNHPYYLCIGEIIGIEQDGLSLRIRLSFGREFVDNGAYMAVLDWSQYSDKELLKRYDEILRDGNFAVAAICREEICSRGLKIAT